MNGESTRPNQDTQEYSSFQVPTPEKSIGEIAEQAGKARRERWTGGLMRRVDQVLGAPEAVREGDRRIREAAKNKAEEVRAKIESAYDTAESQWVDAANRLSDRIDSSITKAEAVVVDKANQAKAKAEQVRNDSINIGVDVGVSLLNKLESLSNLPAVAHELKLGKLYGKQETLESKQVVEVARVLGITLEEASRIASETRMRKNEGQIEGGNEVKPAKTEQKIQNVRAEVDKHITTADRIRTQVMEKFNPIRMALSAMKV